MFKILLYIFFGLSLLADDFGIEQREIRNEQERIDSFKNAQTSQNISLQENIRSDKISLILNEKPCFDIDEIYLKDGGNKIFQKYLKNTLSRLKYKPNLCLGQKSINIIVNELNNEIISKGYITSTIGVSPLNLKNKKIELVLSLGMIDKVLINNEDTSRNRASLFTAFGELEHNKTLNLRTLEQALENISHASSSAVNISLAPSHKLNHTDIIINKNSNLAVNFGLSVDNLGSKQTGKYQISPSVNLLNIFGFNEMFFFSYSKNLKKTQKTSVIMLNGKEDSKGGRSNSYYTSFSVPFGKFNFSIFNTRYSYEQAVAGAYRVYSYSGESKNNGATLSYMYYRDSNAKHLLKFSLWQRSSKNYIEDYELKNQRKKTAGFEIGLSSEIFYPQDTFRFNASYKRGTSWFGSIKPAEQNYGEATNKIGIISLNLAYKKDFLNFIFDSELHARFNKTPLGIQDKLSIGGKHTIRGFDGEMSLVGNRGYYLRNTLSYKIMPTHSIYLALDGGRVQGSTSIYKGSQSLIGYGVGVSGEFRPFGSLRYDIFVGKPAKSPQYFKTDRFCTNFTINYNFKGI